MSKKQFKTFCRISDYIEHVDNNLWQIIDHTCAAGLLNSSKSKSGVTFLWPQDKKFMEKLESLAYSINPEDSRRAADMINALVLRDKFKTAAEFDSKKDDIPNALDPSQHVALKSATGKEVVFASGARAVIDEEFKDSSQRSNLAVWKLVSGEIPVTTDKPSSGKFIRMASVKSSRKSAEKRGGLDSDSQIMRQELIRDIEAKFFSDLGNNTDLVLSKTNPLLIPGLHLVDYIINTGDSLLIDNVLSVYAMNPIDIYFLVQPGRNPNYLIPDEVLEAWFQEYANNSKIDVNKIMKAIKNYFDDAVSQTYQSAQAATFSKCPQLEKEVNLIRAPALNAVPDKNLLNLINKAYNELEEQNKIGSITNVYPASAHSYFIRNRGLKQVQDGLRYMMTLYFAKTEQSKFDKHEFSDYITIVLNNMESDDYSGKMRCSPLFNCANLASTPNAKELVANLYGFINSSCFLQTLCTVENYAERSKSTTQMVNTPFGKLLIDADGINSEKFKNIDSLPSQKSQKNSTINKNKLQYFTEEMRKENVPENILIKFEQFLAKERLLA